MQQAELIAGRFVVEQIAGAGGMGKVYRTRDLVTGERVAVKVLRTESVETARFEREGLVLADLHHPAIVRYVAHGRTPEGALYLAMEWLEGEDLSHRLKHKELTLDESMTLGLRIAAALQEAHRRGVVHRDVKPGNVFLVDGMPERAKLLDFGIARVPGSPQALTNTGHMIGTPGFMAPEQTRGQRDIGPAADVFSLACVLFRCLTGRAPFVAEDVLATLLKVALEDAPHVRDLLPSLPEALDDLVDRMLSKAPGDRPPDGAAVARELSLLGEVVSHHRRDPPSISGVTSVEQRLLCVIVARARTPVEAGAVLATATATAPPASDTQSHEGEMSALVERYGGKLHVLVDGSLFVTLSGSGAATDQAIRAARCALAMRALLPGVPLSLVAGRAVLSGWVPMGEAIDRGVSMLDKGSIEEVRVDDVIAGLVDARFEVGHDATGRYLRFERDGAESPRRLLGKPTVCVGRDAELSRLSALLDECIAEPAAQAVLVTALPGMGKSRLCQELLRQVRDRQPETQIWMGRADLMNAGSPFAMVGSAIRRTAGVHGGELPAVRALKILARVGRHLVGAEQVRVAGLLGELAGGGPVPEARAARSDPRLVGDQMLRAWISFVRAEATAGPLLLVLEDLHWGDIPSVSFVDAALRELSDLPILVLALARPEVREAFPRLWAERPVLEVKLGALSRRAAERLVRRVLGDAVIGSVVDTLVARGAGNAFYLEELIRAVAEGRGEKLPETVLAMAEARLDHLGPAARRVLRAASVFGQVFRRDGVAAVLGDTDTVELGRELAELSRGEFIERHLDHDASPRSAQGEGPRSGPGGSGGSGTLQETFAFRHAIVRDAAYAMLTDEDRAVGHALAGTWLETSGEEDALLLAEHFERGGHPARALGWYHRAAEQALEGSDLEGAIARAEHAIACGAEGEVRGALRILQGEAHAWRDQAAAAGQCCAEAMVLLPQGSVRWCEAVGLGVIVHVQLGDLDRFSALAHDLYRVDPQLDAVERYVVGSVLVTSFLWAGGLYGVARAYLERARAVAGPAAADNPVVRGWLGWGECCRIRYEGGDLQRHMDLAEESAAIFRTTDDLRGTIRLQIELGIAQKNVGRWADAEQLLDEAQKTSQRLGVQILSAGARGYLAWVLLERGRLDEATALAHAAIESTEGSLNVIRAGMAHATLARILARRGDLDGALVEARASVDPRVAATSRVAGLPVLASVLLARGDHEGALARADEAAEILRALGGIPENEALLRLCRAEALAALGRTDEAREALREARARLLDRARTLVDPLVRQSFFEEVEANRRTLELADALCR
jgi:eukaryotic-like serine/threonine-protein kinase